MGTNGGSASGTEVEDDDYEPTLLKLYGELLRVKASNGTLKRLGVSLLVVSVVLAILLALVFNIVQTQRAERASRTISACKQYNDSQRTSRNSKIQDAKDLIAASRADENDPQVKDYLALKRRTNEISFPYRDCSPAGIKAYYKHPPADVSCEKPDGKGFCRAEDQ